MQEFLKAKSKYPKLVSELLALEYTIDQGYSLDYKRDTKRHLKIQKIIYARNK